MRALSRRSSLSFASFRTHPAAPSTHSNMKFAYLARRMISCAPDTLEQSEGRGGANEGRRGRNSTILILDARFGASGPPPVFQRGHLRGHLLDPSSRLRRFHLSPLHLPTCPTRPKHAYTPLFCPSATSRPLCSCSWTLGRRSSETTSTDVGVRVRARMSRMSHTQLVFDTHTVSLDIPRHP